MNELCSKTATEQRQLIRTKAVSAVELLRAHLEQIDAVNDQVNAIVTLVPDHAMDLAESIDTKIHDGEEPGLLAGLPVAHKDLVPTKDIRTTYGSRLFENHIPTENALIVKRLLAAGAITVGKTNTPEWGAGSQTFNEVFGQTRNPYDLAKTCGGSSGGAAVALATRMLPIADGSDMGGSLRNPANFCNVVGFRVSAGRVPAYPNDSAWSTLSVLGPMARTVADCALMLAAIAGPDNRSPISLPESGEVFLQSLQADHSNHRIALSTNFGGQLPVAPEVREIIASSARVFEQVGAHVDEACPDFDGADYAFKTLRAWGFAAKHMENIRQHPDMYKETIVWNAEAGSKLTGAEVARAERVRTSVYQRVITFFEDYDFLVLPVSQVAPFSIDEEYVTAIDGAEMETYIDWMKSCYYISAVGLPAISLPCGFTKEGLPVGIQIVGRPRAELGVLQIAHAFEAETETWKRSPPL